MTQLTPAQMAEQFKKDQEERRIANSYRFPEGNGPDEDGKGHHGKILKAEDTVTDLKKTPMVQLSVLTQERHPKDGKKVEIKINFYKKPNTIAFLYVFLEMAGADLSQLSDPETHDEKLNLLLEALEESNPKIRFNCVWQKPSDDGKPNTFNNYYIKECEPVLKGVLKPVDNVKTPEVETVAPTTVSAQDSVFSDDDD